jgi:methionine synthase II (cobalamin-independent)
MEQLADGLLDGSISPQQITQAWSAASANSVVAKQVLPGPFSTSVSRASSAAAQRAIAERLSDAIAATAAALHEAGCELIQMDEPMATAIGGDRSAWRAFEHILSGVATRVPQQMHRALSLADGAVHPAGHGVIAGLPFESYLIDVLAGPHSWRLIASIPADRTVVCGVVDVHTERARDDPEMIVWAATLAAETGDRGAGLVGIAPNGDLSSLDRFTAKRKIERLGLAMRLIEFGPLTKVARALQPDPASSKSPSLRRLMADHAAAGLLVKEGVWPLASSEEADGT